MANETTRSSAAVEALTTRLDLLNDELRIVGDLLQEIKTDIQWGLQNGRVIISLAEVESLEHVADATIGADAVTLTLRLHAALGLLREDIERAINAQRADPLEVQTTRHAINDCALPEVTLFEEGDAVDFEQNGTELFGEIVALDVARNLATVMLIPSEEWVEVCQDDLIKVDDDDLECVEFVDSPGDRRLRIDTSPADVRPLAVGDTLTIVDDDHEQLAEVIATDAGNRTAELLLSPSMETVTIDWDEAPSRQRSANEQRTLF